MGEKNMMKKLEKAVAELEKRTNTKMRVCDYDYMQGGVPSMSDGYRYALWLYSVTDRNGRSVAVNCGNGRVIGIFTTQAEAADCINSGMFDNL